MGEIRLNKFISEAGVCSRREADRRIEEGRVRVDGIVAAVGTRIPGKRNGFFWQCTNRKGLYARQIPERKTI